MTINEYLLADRQWRRRSVLLTPSIGYHANTMNWPRHTGLRYGDGWEQIMRKGRKVQRLRGKRQKALTIIDIVALMMVSAVMLAALTNKFWHAMGVHL